MSYSLKYAIFRDMIVKDYLKRILATNEFHHNLLLSLSCRCRIWPYTVLPEQLLSSLSFQRGKMLPAFLSVSSSSRLSLRQLSSSKCNHNGNNK